MTWLKGDNISMIAPLTANAIYTTHLRDILKTRVMHDVPIPVYNVIQRIIPRTPGVNRLILLLLSTWRNFK